MRSTREDVRDLERVRYVTENYEDLQGLARVPVGLLVLAVWGFFLISNFEISSKFVADVVITLSLLIGGVMILLFFRIKGYYRRRYGRVRVIPNVFKKRRVYSGVIALVVSLLASYLALWMGVMENLDPFPFILLGLGIMEVIDRWPERRFRPHHFVVGVLMALSGLILWLLVLSDRQYPDALVLHLLTALFVLSLVVGGILDHLLLVRTMKSLPEEDDGRVV